MYQKIQTQNSLIRPLPYPYRAGISISSDAEFFEFNFFEELMKFLNTNRLTRFGPGLKLECTASVFFFSDKAYNFSYYQGLEADAKESSLSPRLRDYIRSGLIDTNHAHGDFDGHPVFTRFHAQRILDDMRAAGLVVRVFTNHGGRENIQNIGADSDYHEGDRPHSAAYHRDLLEQLGTSFVWTDSLTYAKPQAVVSEVTKRRFSLRPRKISPAVQNDSIKILVDSPMQDGKFMTGFMRLRSTGRNAPNLSSFKYQIDQINFTDLYKNFGAMVVYQHLGVLARENSICQQAQIEDILQNPNAYLAGFYKLSEEAKSGNLWVCGLFRFLTYLKMIETVNIQEEGDGSLEVIYPETVSDPQAFFAGLTIYTPVAKDIRLSYRGKKLEVIFNGPDDTDCYSFTVKMETLEDIWE